MLLPDINVWLALVFDGHVHHPLARHWFDALSNEVCGFCRITQQGFLRLATNPRVFGPNTQSMAEAWRLYDSLLGDERVAFAEEPSQLENTWRTFTNRSDRSPNVWTDAYLAAFAVAGNYEVVSLDRGLMQFAPARIILLQ